MLPSVIGLNTRSQRLTRRTRMGLLNVHGGQNGYPCSNRLWAQNTKTILWQQWIQVQIVGSKVPRILRYPRNFTSYNSYVDSTFMPNYTVTHRSMWQYGFHRKEHNHLFQVRPVLNNKILSLIMRDAKDNGHKASGILREHYLSKGKPKVIFLYTELTSLKSLESESITDYIIRAENIYNSLKEAL